MDLAKPKPYGFDIRSSTGFVVTAVCLGLFTDSFTYCSIIPVLPSALVGRAGVPHSHIQYYVSMMMASFSIVFFIAAPILGHASDHLKSRRQPFIWGMLANIASLLLFMIATSPLSMALARGFQGFSSAAILVVGMALIKDAVGKEKTGEGMGYSTVAIQSGLILGPSIGGLLYDKAGYEAVFILPAVLLAIDIFLRLMIVENGAAEAFDERAINAENSDSVGDSPVRPSDPDLTERTALLESRNHEQSNQKTLWQRFPVLRLITHSRMVTALLVAALDVAIFSALETTIPLFVMRLFDWTPTKTGILFLATCTPGIILGYILGKSIDRSGSLLPAAGGITVAAACLIAQRIVHENTLRDEIILIALFTASNISMLFVNITMSAEVGLVAQEVDEETGGGGMVGKGYALNMMACSGGQLLGPLIGGFMVEKTGWAGMTLLLGALCLAALPGILLFAGGGIIALHRKSLDSKGAENFRSQVV